VSCCWHSSIKPSSSSSAQHVLCWRAVLEVHQFICLSGLLRLSAEFLEEPYVKSLLKKW
jgi:hypothetical protein